MPKEKFKPISVKPPSSNVAAFVLRRAIDLQLNTIAKYLRPAMANLRGKIIDVGAGESPWREWLPKSASYFGIDVGNADEFGMQANDGDITYYDGRTIPFSDASFDGALCIEVLEHVEKPEELIKEVARCLVSGATLLLSVPWSARRHHIPHDYHRFTRERLKLLLETNGFTQIEIKERGTDISVIANKLVVLSTRLAPAHGFWRALWTLPLLIVVAPITIGFLISAHVTEWLGFGAKEDPLGYFVQATRC
jgi:SAM-dependent methyltransferase